MEDIIEYAKFNILQNIQNENALDHQLLSPTDNSKIVSLYFHFDQGMRLRTKQFETFIYSTLFSTGKCNFRDDSVEDFYLLKRINNISFVFNVRRVCLLIWYQSPRIITTINNINTKLYLINIYKIRYQTNIHHNLYRIHCIPLISL